MFLISVSDDVKHTLVKVPLQQRPACRHRFCTVTGHFQAALED